MNTEILVVEPAGPLRGSVELAGAKNSVLVMMAALLLVRGVSRLRNVPNLVDVQSMIALLESLGASVVYCVGSHELVIDTRDIQGWSVGISLMQKTRASILVMGALLARCGSASVALPGGDVIGARPIDYHLKSLQKLGVEIVQEGSSIHAHASVLKGARIVLEYPSVGATENIILAATAAQGVTTIVNAAIEPEVVDLISLLSCMGARITMHPSAMICVEGGHPLEATDYTVMVDRLEAGTILLAAAISGGDVYLHTAQADKLDLLLFKLEEMGHTIRVNHNQVGVRLSATQRPRAVSFKTGPYPNFPTDLQAPMMVAQCYAQGPSIIEETVFENRLSHVPELIKMGAQIIATQAKAHITGVLALYGTKVEAKDIRASSALVLAGLAAQGNFTAIDGVSHWRRGYEALEDKLTQLGACIYTQMDTLPVADDGFMLLEEGESTERYAAKATQ
jgi:UDP-N-acetylglucosamine 1-carboxyvinyltransferase